MGLACSGPSRGPRLNCWSSACREQSQTPLPSLCQTLPGFPSGRCREQGCWGRRSGRRQLFDLSTSEGWQGCRCPSARLSSVLASGPRALTEQHPCHAARPSSFLLPWGLASLCQLRCHLSQAWQVEIALRENGAAPSRLCTSRPQVDVGKTGPHAYTHPLYSSSRHSLDASSGSATELTVEMQTHRAGPCSDLGWVEGTTVVAVLLRALRGGRAEGKDFAENVT